MTFENETSVILALSILKKKQLKSGKIKFLLNHFAVKFVPLPASIKSLPGSEKDQVLEKAGKQQIYFSLDKNLL